MKHESQSAFRREQRMPVTAGNLFTRQLTARTIASLRRCGIADVAGELWPDDRALMQMITRAPSSPAMTSQIGWAAQLVHTIVADTLAAMGAASGAADVMKRCLTLEWDGAGIISAPAFIANAGNSGFVQEGQPIPVRQLGQAPIQLQPYKLATIAALTREMVESSNAEALITDALIRSIGLALDIVFFGSNPATAAQPAGIRYNAPALPASANADAYGAFAEDISSLINAVSAVGGKGPYLFVGSPGRITTMRMHYATEENPVDYDVVVSTAVGDDLVVIAPKAIVAALNAEPDVEAVSAATLVMDTAPGPAGVSGSEKEMWQTDSIAAKVRWPVTWALRDPHAVAWTTPAWK
jgi:hypothetical protein